jgi:amidase
MTDDDLGRLGAAELAQAVRARRIGALQATDAALARIAAQTCNAVVVLDVERARQRARALDAALANGDTAVAAGPLLGVPMTVKESYDVAGLPTTWGLPPHAGHVATTDALLVQRLEAAGAVVLGKSNVPPALGDWQAANPLHGRTLNPHDPTRTPGGSSGGSAAALAAGLVPLELGSDIGGSIRVPAHCCGVFGHKPSRGLLPSRGHAFPGTDGAGVELAVCGPLARDAADLALAFEVLAGADAQADPALRLQLPPPRTTSPRGARLAVLAAHPLARAARDVRGVLQATADALASAGAAVEAAPAALLPDLEASHHDYVQMLGAIMSRGARGDGTREPISAHRWMDLLDAQARVRRQWARVFERFDALLLPVFGTTAFAHVDEPDWHRRELLIDGEATPFGRQIAWSAPATWAGLPATVAPAGRGDDGLPIGVQIVGPWQEDRTPLALAGMVQALRAAPAHA